MPPIFVVARRAANHRQLLLTAGDGWRLTDRRQRCTRGEGGGEGVGVSGPFQWERVHSAALTPRLTLTKTNGHLRCRTYATMCSA